MGSAGEKPAFVICQYKKQGFDVVEPFPLGHDRLNMFILPDGKIDTESVLFSEFEAERDSWILSIARAIAIKRPNDSLNEKLLKDVSMRPVINPRSQSMKPSKLAGTSAAIQDSSPTDATSSTTSAKMSSSRRQGGIGAFAVDLASPQTRQPVNDDQQKIMAQPQPASMILHAENAANIVPSKGKKTGMFSDWMKRKPVQLPKETDLNEQKKVVFGVSLQEAVEACHVMVVPLIPAVVYRCIEFLEVNEGLLLLI